MIPLIVTVIPTLIALLLGTYSATVLAAPVLGLALLYVAVRCLAAMGVTRISLLAMLGLIAVIYGPFFAWGCWAVAR